jgi:hypothetical protein
MPNFTVTPAKAGIHVHQRLMIPALRFANGRNDELRGCRAFFSILLVELDKILLDVGRARHERAIAEFNACSGDRSPTHNLLLRRDRFWIARRRPSAASHLCGSLASVHP